MISAGDNVNSEGYLIFFTFLPHKSSPRFLPSLLHTAHEKLVAKGQAVEKSEGKNLSHPQAV